MKRCSGTSGSRTGSCLSSRPEQLLELLAGGHLTQRTVLWLPTLISISCNPSGERIAAALRDLLRQPSLTPVAVVATLWPPYWDELTRELREGFPILRCGASDSTPGPDTPHPQARVESQLLIDRPGKPGNQPHHGERGAQSCGGQPFHGRLLNTAAGSSTGRFK